MSVVAAAESCCTAKGCEGRNACKCANGNASLSEVALLSAALFLKFFKGCLKMLS